MKILFDICRSGPVMILVMALIIGLTMGMAIGPDLAGADLTQTKFVSFMGVDYTGNLGNTTGATTAVTLETNEVPDEFNCFFSVQTSAGEIIANTATVEIQTSYKGSDWDVYQSVSVAASAVTGIRGTGGATTPLGDKWRMNISAIQNANSSYVTGQCIFE
jgi:hypothetical protein